MNHEASILTLPNGAQRFVQSWLPAGQPYAVLIVVHGLGEHSGRYADFAAWFTDRGCAVHAFDLHGHGRSPGKRGHLRRWEEFRDDTAAFLGHVASRHPNTPRFLVGHSMGGLIVLDYGLHLRASDDLHGIIASGPPLGRGENVSPVRMWAARMMAKLLPSLHLSNGLDAAWLSRDETVVRAYRTDPLVHGYITPGLGAAMMATMETVMAQATSWPADLPLLIVHGEADPICPPQASARFFEQAGARDKTYRTYPGYLHEVFNEVGREAVLSDVWAWIQAHR